MMQKIGITGGIGTGKSVVSELLRIMGYPVFDTDLEAKQLMLSSSEIRRKLILAFGPETYLEKDLNRSYLSSLIFKNPQALAIMNGIVHPEVRTCFKKWAENQNSAIVFFESAILFESDFYRLADQIWTVSAPESLRYQRVIKRDGCSREKVSDRMAAQLPQLEKERRSQYVILNDEIHAIIPQVAAALKGLSKK